jgi:hypothetical protein
MADDADELDIAGLMTMAPGDHVLVALRSTLDPAEAQEMHDALADLFPGVGFTFLTDVSSVAILRDPGGEPR